MRRTLAYETISKARTELMGLAILAVVFYHAWSRWPAGAFGAPLDFFFSTLYCAVDIFLFLSGFGLVRSRLTNPVPWPRFLYRRFIRIIPAYWLTLLALTAYEALVTRALPLGKAFFRFSLLGFWFGRQGPLASEWFIPTLLGMYLLFPLLFLGYTRARKRGWFIAGVSLAALLVGIAPILAGRNNLLMWTTRIPAFILGIHYGHVVFAKDSKREGAPVWRALLGVLFSCAALLVIFALTTEEQRWRYGLWWPPFIPAIVPSCLLLSRAIAAVKVAASTDGRRRKLAQPLVWLLSFCGAYSLEILLLHEPVYHLSATLTYLDVHVPAIGQVMGVINRGRYFEFALYAVVALALAPWLSRAAAWIRRGMNAIFDRERGGAAAARS